MSLSTPINSLRRNGDTSSTPNFSMDNKEFSSEYNNNFNSQSSESQLVEDILKEMGESPGLEQQSNINSQAYQYSMDNSQIPIYKNMPEQDTYNDKHYTEKMMHQQQQINSGLFNQMGINLNGASIKDKIIKNIKYPGLVFVISFIISLPEFNRFLFSFFPKLLLESGQVSIGGVLLKSVVGMLLFAIIAIFI
jgi:hypothetical protein